MAQEGSKEIRIQFFWGFERPITLFGSSIGSSLRLFQTRQQAQQPFYPWGDRQFSLDEYIPFRRSDLVRNGSLFKIAEGFAAGHIRSHFPPPLLSPIDRLFEGPLSSLTQNPKTKKALVNTVKVAVTTGIASVVVHPFTLMYNWDIVQDSGKPAKSVFRFSTYTETVSDIKKTYRSIKEAKKSFYDGLGATLCSNIAFEVIKLRMNAKIREAIDFDRSLGEMEACRKTMRTSLVEEEKNSAAKRLCVLRWRRLAMRYCVGYGASLAAELLVYPLLTISLKLQAQGASFRFPVMYNGGLDCASRVIQEEGIVSLYAGVSTLVCSVFPELLAAGGTYVAVILGIEAISDQTREQVLDPILDLIE
mmetsp:Transcript_29857/g.41245  ORF Transcript_29857/g.41245 Transcript_29857/m.41245 type:complete len:362 (+) Transcript_29857:68-1153(+)|eukprot:CAMPEP_0201491866 /NCGR_PEP_ID=MMETSP0151_2-20130828/31571_1 /ASSEMBLY_ACC=CAM_ASM_000257 /TAXON_ID=200890 /ORGANISM="Paramoeba atlantica, Strain 621/1 / CCAP 1560/9" /LENGTH=361 /DNA_ID=CAMNT_0047878433 /DNA_START=42 /DNA_END=1127 /DNA_ORIENTATION=-